MADVCLSESTAAGAEVGDAIGRRRRRMELRRLRLAGDGEDEGRRPKKLCVPESVGSSSDIDVSGGGDGSAPAPAPALAPGNLAQGHGSMSVRGRRREMEDAVSVHREFAGGSSFYAVFDGHGCSHVATSCQSRMHEILAEEHAKRGDEETWKESMQRSFARMDQEATSWSTNRGDDQPVCRCEQSVPSRCEHVGSTAVVAVVDWDKIVIANCGDSRAVLSRSNGAIPLSVDHKPDRPDELARIEAAGGKVIYWDGARVLGVLAMSRAIGDGYLKPYVTSVPEVTVTERSDGDECLILASDGLWDVMTNEMACGIARSCLHGGGAGSSDKACADAAMLLTNIALARRSSDNVSVVVVDLRRDQ